MKAAIYVCYKGFLTMSNVENGFLWLAYK